MRRHPKILIIDVETSPDVQLEQMLHSMQPQAELCITSDPASVLAKTRQDIIVINADLQQSLPLLQQLHRAYDSEDSCIITIINPDQSDRLNAFIQAGTNDFIFTPLYPAIVNLALQKALRALNDKQRMRQLQYQFNSAKTKLEATFLKQDAFCRTLAHDLNNSLTGMIMTAEMLLISNPPETTVAAIREILDGCDEIKATVTSQRAAFESGKGVQDS